MKCFKIRPAKKKTIGQNYKTMNEIFLEEPAAELSPSKIMFESSFECFPLWRLHSRQKRSFHPNIGERCRVRDANS